MKLERAKLPNGGWIATLDLGFVHLSYHAGIRRKLRVWHANGEKGISWRQFTICRDD